MSGINTRRLVVAMDETERSEGGEFTVTLRIADQLRAELEGKKLGFSEVHHNPLHLQALFAWACMVREGHYTGKFADFRNDCIAVSDHKDDDPTDPDAGEPVDPTTPAASTDSA